LLLNPEATHGEISTRIGTSPSTASWYLNKLLQTSLIIPSHTGRQTRYKLTDPVKIQRLLSLYENTWQNKVIDGFASVWEDNRLTIKKR
ncbi:MAG TPA: winged helix-turn-helix domain-containing protein, partial [Candidatus Binatus sp.]|nr:winged helix-turn-helix domain-containing protein [Candidatus Binatus sp.]